GLVDSDGARLGRLGLAYADRQTSVGIAGLHLVGIGMLRKLDDAPERACKALPRIGAFLVVSLVLRELALAADREQSLIDGDINRCGIEPRSKRDDLDGVVRTADVYLGKGAEPSGADAGRKAAKKALHLPLQTVEFTE